MVMYPVRPDAVVFDVLGTLFSTGRLERAFAELGLPPASVELFLARLTRDGFAAAAAGTFATFDDLAAHHLQLLAGAAPGAGDEPDHRLVGRIMAALGELDPFEDAGPALREASSGRLRAAVLTNLPAEVVHRLVERAGLTALTDRLIDVSEVMVWKPRREPYQHAAEVLKVDAERLALITAHPWDVHGATAAGLLGAWVNRRGEPYPPFMNQPQLQGASLDELVRRLLALEP